MRSAISLQGGSKTGPGRRRKSSLIKPKRQIIFVMVFFTLLVVSLVPCCYSYGIGKKILFRHLRQLIGRRVAILSLL